MAQKPRLFLASRSPRREALLKQFEVPFTVIKNGLENEPPFDSSTSIKKQIRQLATEKALKSKKNYEGYVLGVDTVVVLGKNILGKPKDLDDARSLLKSLSGKRHSVISGFCLLDTRHNTKICRTETSFVSFNVLSPSEIDAYCKNFQVLDKAGAYAIQDIGKTFVSKLQGSYYNVMGLPIHTLLKILRLCDIVT